MRSNPPITPPRGAGIFAAGLSVLALVLSSATPVRAQGANAADAEFLTQVVPSIAASVKIIDYEVKNTSDATVREFAQRVLKQHTESVKTATEHARRLKIAVDTSGEKDSKEMLDKLSALKGSERDAAFLEWLSHIHHDTTLFDNEVKNGSDAALKSYAKGSITAGNGHHDEAQELLAKLKK